MLYKISINKAVTFPIRHFPSAMAEMESCISPDPSWDLPCLPTFNHSIIFIFSQVMLSSLFKEVELFHAKSVTLTLMYEEEEIDTAATLNFDPMEIKAYQVKLK